MFENLSPFDRATLVMLSFIMLVAVYGLDWAAFRRWMRARGDWMRLQRHVAPRRQDRQATQPQPRVLVAKRARPASGLILPHRDPWSFPPAAAWWNVPPTQRITLTNSLHPDPTFTPSVSMEPAHNAAEQVAQQDWLTDRRKDWLRELPRCPVCPRPGGYTDEEVAQMPVLPCGHHLVEWTRRARHGVSQAAIDRALPLERVPERAWWPAHEQN